MKQDLQNQTDIIFLVDAFYGRIREDELLGPIFMSIIRDNWPAHLEKMYRFWDTILLGAHSYQGTPFAPHAHMGIDAVHFERWIEIFHDCVDTHFSGEKAEEAKLRSEKMATLFLSKIQYIRSHPNQFIQ
jgi:hemoglobin